MALTWTRRSADVHTESVDGSVLAYDLDSTLVHCISDDTLAVYAACDGVSAEHIAEATGFDVATVAAHLRELESRNLVAATGADQLSRKRLLAGASAAAVLAVWTMGAPAAAAASSTGVVDVTTTTETTTEPP
jgi:hypothetical protein